VFVQSFFVIKAISTKKEKNKISNLLNILNQEFKIIWHY